MGCSKTCDRARDHAGPATRSRLAIAMAGAPKAVCRLFAAPASCIEDLLELPRSSGVSGFCKIVYGSRAAACTAERRLPPRTGGRYMDRCAMCRGRRIATGPASQAAATARAGHLRRADGWLDCQPLRRARTQLGGPGRRARRRQCIGMARQCSPRVLRPAPAAPAAARAMGPGARARAESGQRVTPTFSRFFSHSPRPQPRTVPTGSHRPASVASNNAKTKEDERKKERKKERR